MKKFKIFLTMFSVFFVFNTSLAMEKNKPRKQPINKNKNYSNVNSNNKNNNKNNNNNFTYKKKYYDKNENTQIYNNYNYDEYDYNCDNYYEYDENLDEEEKIYADFKDKNFKQFYDAFKLRINFVLKMLYQNIFSDINNAKMLNNEGKKMPENETIFYIKNYVNIYIQNLFAYGSLNNSDKELENLILQITNFVEQQCLIKFVGKEYEEQLNKKEQKEHIYKQDILKYVAQILANKTPEERKLKYIDLLTKINEFLNLDTQSQVALNSLYENYTTNLNKIIEYNKNLKLQNNNKIYINKKTNVREKKYKEKTIDYQEMQKKYNEKLKQSLEQKIDNVKKRIEELKNMILQTTIKTTKISENYMELEDTINFIKKNMKKIMTELKENSYSMVDVLFQNDAENGKIKKLISKILNYVKQISIYETIENKQKFILENENKNDIDDYIKELIKKDKIFIRKCANSYDEYLNKNKYDSTYNSILEDLKKLLTETKLNEKEITFTSLTNKLSSAFYCLNNIEYENFNKREEEVKLEEVKKEKKEEKEEVKLEEIKKEEKEEKEEEKVKLEEEKEEVKLEEVKEEKKEEKEEVKEEKKEEKEEEVKLEEVKEEEEKEEVKLEEVKEEKKSKKTKRKKRGQVIENFDELLNQYTQNDNKTVEQEITTEKGTNTNQNMCFIVDEKLQNALNNNMKNVQLQNKFLELKNIWENDEEFKKLKKIFKNANKNDDYNNFIYNNKKFMKIKKTYEGDPIFESEAFKEEKNYDSSDEDENKINEDEVSEYKANEDKDKYEENKGELTLKFNNRDNNVAEGFAKISDGNSNDLFFKFEGKDVKSVFNTFLQNDSPTNDFEDKAKIQMMVPRKFDENYKNKIINFFDNGFDFLKIEPLLLDIMEITEYDSYFQKEIFKLFENYDIKNLDFYKNLKNETEEFNNYIAQMREKLTQNLVENIIFKIESFDTKEKLFNAIFKLNKYKNKEEKDDEKVKDNNFNEQEDFETENKNYIEKLKDLENKLEKYKNQNHVQNYTDFMTKIDNLMVNFKKSRNKNKTESKINFNIRKTEAEVAIKKTFKILHVLHTVLKFEEEKIKILKDAKENKKFKENDLAVKLVKSIYKDKKKQLEDVLKENEWQKRLVENTISSIAKFADDNNFSLF